MPVLDAWGATPSGDFPNYAAGSWGPEAVQGLLAQPDHRWAQPAELVNHGDAKQGKTRHG
jgi:glucose-6-phosphate 1-dehydrogenase